MNNTQMIINDIKGLRGTKVEIFGQWSDYPEAYKDELTIDILDILYRLKEFEVDGWIEVYNEESEDYEEVCADSVDAYLEHLHDMGYININESKGDNSYNWSSPVSNDFNINIYESLIDDSQYIELKVHRYGDVRCNYTETALYHFSNEYEFYEIVSECNKYITIDVNGEEYNCEVSIFNDSIEVWDNNGYYVDSVCAYDMEELINGIEEAI